MMSDSTIDDVLRLVEIGKGNPDRLKQILESYEKRSLISMQDRKYVEALVAQYLTPRHRVSIKKIEPIRKQQIDTPRIRKPSKPTFDPKTDNISTKNKIETASTETNNICIKCNASNPSGNNFCNECGSSLQQTEKTVKTTNVEENDNVCMKCNTVNPSGNNFCNECGSSLQQTEKTVSINKINKIESEFERYEREYLERMSGTKTDSDAQEVSLEEKFVEQVETEKPSRLPHRKSNKKFIGIGIGIVAILIIGGGAVFMTGGINLSSNLQVEDRATCDNKPMLVSSTKIPGFPDPEKDLQYYLDRYNNEPKYADWFDRNFPGQTIQNVVC